MKRQQVFRTVAPGLNLAIVAVLIANLIAAPVVVDSIHMADTALLANIGWRGVHGLWPVSDYPHFYGGAAEWFVISSFKLFGASYHALNYALIGMFLASGLSTWFLAWGRLSAARIVLLLTVAAALLISLDPIEDSGVTGVGHSFAYNHVGIVLISALTVFSCKELADRRADALAGATAGFVLYGLVLCKTTFVVLAPFVLVACLLQGRLLPALSVLAGFLVGMAFLDPGASLALGSLHMLMGSSAAAAGDGIHGRLREAALIVRAQGVALALCVILLFGILRRGGAGSLAFVASLAACGAGYGAAILTMGGVPDLKLLPFVATASLLLADRFESDPDPASRYGQLLAATLAFVCAYLLIVPSVFVSGFALAQSVRHARDGLVYAGPLSEYYFANPFSSRALSVKASPLQRRKAAVDEALKRMGSLGDDDTYVITADGLALLSEIPRVASYGIISNGRNFEFTMPLQSKVVRSFPIWPTTGLPGLKSRDRLQPDVDIVMMARPMPQFGLVSSDLEPLMRPDFRICRRSAFWTLFARPSVPDSACSVRAAESNAVTGN